MVITTEWKLHKIYCSKVNYNNIYKSINFSDLIEPVYKILFLPVTFHYLIKFYGQVECFITSLFSYFYSCVNLCFTKHKTCIKIFIFYVYIICEFWFKIFNILPNNKKKKKNKIKNFLRKWNKIYKNMRFHLKEITTKR